MILLLSVEGNSCIYVCVYFKNFFLYSLGFKYVECVVYFRFGYDLNGILKMCLFLFWFK